MSDTQSKSTSRPDKVRQLKAEKVSSPIGDFSGVRWSTPSFVRFIPESAQDVAALVDYARRNKKTLRSRAQGHSLNGSSLPQAGELSITSDALQYVRFDAPGTVTVGSGAVLWTLRDLLLKTGFDLPMLNDGYPGPTVGGYLSAGGIGPQSAEVGGFWNNVVSILMVDGLGRQHLIKPENPAFLWLFGAMGQLGFIVEATLKIMPSAIAQSPTYPNGLHLTAPFLDKPVIPPEFQLEDNQGLFWFTLICPANEYSTAHNQLERLEQRYLDVLQFQERYNYPIRRMGVDTPPLLHPFSGDLLATGAWGWLREISDRGITRLIEFDREFGALTSSSTSYRRYIQSELPNNQTDYLRCFGREVFDTFYQLKQYFDPDHLFNRNSVFPLSAK